MSLFEAIKKDMYAAMKSGDKIKVTELRVALSRLKDKRIATRSDLSAADELKILQALVKQHQESIESYTKGGRQDLVDIEQAELAHIEHYLPQMLSESEIHDLVKAAIAETGATGMQAIGKVMPLVMPLAAGRADGRLAQGIVRELLT
ncbi:MAG: GatB/YqeY domain-containing protein [Candidatus Marinimicrobia bacterium]|nr:GatB/YqeY domain-containing protein [Candidatus Neomarinimicrobiota bacterium]